MVERITNWVAKNAPKREDLAESRWMKPFGSRVLHSEFWRFTRRSVPRGVAVGLFVGVFLLIPGVQIVGAALLSIPFRAQHPGRRGDDLPHQPVDHALPDRRLRSRSATSSASTPTSSRFYALIERGAGVGELVRHGCFRTRRRRWCRACSSSAPRPALVGYFLSVLVWRWWIARKWRRRASCGGR